MQDLDLLARQLRRETEQGAEARHRLTNNTREAEEKQYASSTVYGQKLLKHSTGVIAEHMTKSLNTPAKGAVDRRHGLQTPQGTQTPRSSPSSPSRLHGHPGHQ